MHCLLLFDEKNCQRIAQAIFPLSYSKHVMYGFCFFWRPVQRKRLRLANLQAMQGKDRLDIRMANKIFKVYIKNVKTSVVDDLTKDYATVPLSSRSNMAGQRQSL
jgi:hypothetical protein